LLWQQSSRELSGSPNCHQFSYPPQDGEGDKADGSNGADNHHNPIS